MEQLVRYSAPTRYDLAPRGTICKVMGDADVYSIYIQAGNNPETASWLPIGDLLEKTFASYIVDHEFIKACLDICDGTEGAHMQIIVKKISS